MYQPWVRKPGLIEAQKIMVLEAGATLPTPLGEFKTAEVDYFLFEWPDSATQTMMNKFKEIAADVQREFAERPAEAILADVKKMVDKVSKRSYFTALEFTGKEQIDWVNTQGKNINKPWRFDHLLGGVTGMHYDWKEGEPILTHNEFIRIWGITNYLVTQVKAGKNNKKVQWS